MKKDTRSIKVMNWLETNKKHTFLMAQNISGFHPKAMFWKTKGNRYFSLIGSSNLTSAAFNSNYEVNIFSEITEKNFNAAEKWLDKVRKKSVLVNEAVLDKYKEGQYVGKNLPKKQKNLGEISIPLPRITNEKGLNELIKDRQNQILLFNKNKEGMTSLFQDCADGKKTSSEFYNELQNKWRLSKDSFRLQGYGWERTGKNSDFRILAVSFLNILNAKDYERDNTVVSEINKLKEKKIETRKAFLSEMLCLFFPDLYIVYNKPTEDYLQSVGFNIKSKGKSEGERYYYLVKLLRKELLRTPDYPAVSLAELDAIIWRESNLKRENFWG